METTQYSSNVRMVLLLVGALLLALVFSTPPQASAGNELENTSSEADVFDPDLPDDAKLVTTEEEAIEQDALRISASTGTPVEAVLDQLAFQGKVIAMIETLPAKVLESIYASAKFDFSGSPKVTLYFKGDIPDNVRSHVDAARLSGVELRGGMEFSLNELKARNDTIHAAVLGLGFTEIVSAIDVESQRITVDIVLSDDLPNLRGGVLRGAIHSQLIAPLRASFEQAGNELNIRTHPIGSKLTTLIHGYGGSGFRDDSKRECTSGFVVRRTSDWKEGVLTASHCEGLNRLEQNNSNGGVTLTFSAPWKGETLPSGNYGDLEWHTTTHDDFPQFWFRESARRTVSGRITNAAISLGALVCHYGRASGYSCGDVTVVSSTASFIWEGNGQIVTVQDVTDVGGNIVCDFGDSGGPFFAALTAWGITHGLRGGPAGDCIFSKIQNAEIAFGVFVQTG